MSDSAHTTPDAGASTTHFAVSLRSQADQARERLAAYQARWKDAEADLDQHILRLDALLAESTARIRDLEAQLADAEKCPSVAAAPSSGDSDDFRRRYQMALDDLRDLKAENSKLEQQIAKLRKTGSRSEAAGGAPAATLNWEAEKARIMALLEAESEPTAERRVERAKVAEVIAATDRLLAEKDREIAELKRQLAEQPKTVAAPMAGRANVAASSVDEDTTIREERDKLQQLQKEWRDKLRLAEVDLSLERAKLARERAGIEGKYQGQPPRPQAGEESGASQAAKVPRGRWLARLGLGNDEPKPDPPKTP